MLCLCARLVTIFEEVCETYNQTVCLKDYGVWLLDILCYYIEFILCYLPAVESCSLRNSLSTATCDSSSSYRDGSQLKLAMIAMDNCLYSLCIAINTAQYNEAQHSKERCFEESYIAETSEPSHPDAYRHSFNAYIHVHQCSNLMCHVE